MGKRDALARFRKADELYRAERYVEALTLLDALDAEFPNQKNVLFPKARCLYHLRQFEEALSICQDLVLHHGDAKAQKLIERIKATMSGPHTLPLGADLDFEKVELPKLDDPRAGSSMRARWSGLLTPAKPRPPDAAPPAPAKERNWPMIAGIAAGIVVLLLVVSLPWLAPGDAKSGEHPAPSSSPTTVVAAVDDTGAMPVWGITHDGRLVYRGYTLTWVGLIGAFMFAGWVQYCINLGGTLFLLRRMPHESFFDNFIEIGSAALIGILMTGTLFGLIRVVMLLHEKYDFGILEFAILATLALLTTGATWGGVAYLYISTMIAIEA